MFRRVNQTVVQKAAKIATRTITETEIPVNAVQTQKSRNLMTALFKSQLQPKKTPRPFANTITMLKLITFPSAFFSSSSFKPNSEPSEIKINIYQKLKTIVAAALESAEKNDKPLLICIGELHSDYNSYLVQAILLNLLENTKLKNFFLETTPNDLNSRRAGIGCYFEEIVRTQFKMELIPIDHPDSDKLFTITDAMRCQIENDHSTFERSILIREKYMIDKLLNQKSNGIYVTGGKHLPAFIQNEVLNNAYHIVCVDISIYNDELRKDFKNRSLTNGQLDQERVEYLLTSTKINRFIDFNIPIQKYPKSAEEIFDEVQAIKNIFEKNNMPKLPNNVFDKRNIL